MARYSIYPSIFNTGGTPLTLNNVSSVRPSTGVSQLIARAGGAVTRAAVGTAFADPRVSFTTRDLATILGAVSLTSGLAITSASLLQYQLRADGGTFAGGSSHIALRSHKGFLYPTSIRATQDQTDGVPVDLDYMVLDDGTNAVLEILSAQALSGSPAVTDIFYLGPVVVEGVQLTGVRETSVTPGIGYETIRTDGSPYPTEGSITSVNQEMRVTSVNLAGLAARGLFGEAISTGVTFYFQRGLHGGDRRAFGDAVHLSITAATGYYDFQEIPVEQGGDALPTLSILPTGSLAINTATTIPL
jgi:hypothetical protein